MQTRIHGRSSDRPSIPVGIAREPSDTSATRRPRPPWPLPSDPESNSPDYCHPRSGTHRGFALADHRPAAPTPTPRSAEPIAQNFWRRTSQLLRASDNTDDHDYNGSMKISLIDIG